MSSTTSRQQTFRSSPREGIHLRTSAHWQRTKSSFSELTFLVTRIGCGIAGFRDAEMAPLFAQALDLSNVVLPKTFVDVLQK